jgi:hypothetical protein
MVGVERVQALEFFPEAFSSCFFRLLSSRVIILIKRDKQLC